MSRIGVKLAQLRAKGEKAFIPYITAGYPSLEETAALVRELARRGADIIELGVPFSDPVADGPTIQRSSEKALAHGTTLTSIIGLVAQLRRDGVETPLIFMTYCNPINRYGWERFFQDAAAAGVDGCIIPDLPFEESAEPAALAQGVGLDLIPFFAPTTSAERMHKIAAGSTGFIYCVSLTGVTGARGGLSANLSSFLGRAKEATDLPLAVGFGISNPEQAAEVAQYADGVIIGSAIINIIEENEDTGEAATKVGEFASRILIGLGRNC